MTPPRPLGNRARSRLARARVLPVVVALSAAACGSTATSLPPASSGLLAHGRYVAAASFDDGAVWVAPAASMVQATRPASAVAVQAWSTSALVGYRSVSLAFGIVTVTARAQGVAAVRRLPAWVALGVRGAASSCPMMTGTPPTHRALPSDGQVLVVIGDRAGTPAVVYTAASAPCGRVVPATLADARQVVSVPWSPTGQAADGVVVVAETLPSCGRDEGSSLEGTRSTVTIQLFATIPESAPGGTCATTVERRVSLSVAPSVTPATPILHGAVGPSRITSDPYRWSS